MLSTPALPLTPCPSQATFTTNIEYVAQYTADLLVTSFPNMARSQVGSGADRICALRVYAGNVHRHVFLLCGWTTWRGRLCSFCGWQGVEPVQFFGLAWSLGVQCRHLVSRAAYRFTRAGCGQLFQSVWLITAMDEKDWLQSAVLKACHTLPSMIRRLPTNVAPPKKNITDFPPLG